MRTKTYVPYLTGLRGYAALMVFTIHAGNFIPQGNSYIQSLVAYGSQGVPIFFFLSALTISLSLSQKRFFSFKDYISRRAQRILPMYYFFMLLGFLFSWARVGGSYYREIYQVLPHSVSNIFFHLSLLNFFHQKYLLTLTGIGSMIPFEFAYYFLIPPLYFLIKKSNWLFLLVILIGSFLYFNPAIKLPIYVTVFGSGDLTLERHLFTYGVGILCYKIIQQKIINFDFIRQFLSIALLFVTALYIFQHITFNERAMFFFISLIIGYSILFKNKLLSTYKHRLSKCIFKNIDLLLLLLVFLVYVNITHSAVNIFTTLNIGAMVIASSSGGFIKNLVFENRLILKLGEVSYPFFLSHLIIISAVGKYLTYNNIVSYFFLIIISFVVAQILFSTENKMSILYKYSIIVLQSVKSILKCKYLIH